YFHGDKMPDLAVVGAGSNTVTVLRGKGAGTFAPVQTLTVGINPAAVAVGDFNGDGIQDLAVANYGCGGGYYDCLAPGLAPGPTTPSTTVTVLFGKSDGTFEQTKALTVNVVLGPNSIADGDFNGDGIADLAVASYYPTNTVTVLLGQGDGTFQPAPSGPNPVGGGPWSIAVGDFNGDGKLDLAVATYITDLGTISVLLGKGDGTFQPAVSY